MKNFIVVSGAAGYSNAPKWSGKMLILDPEHAMLIQRAFEEFASAQFMKQEVLALVTNLDLRGRHGQALSPAKSWTDAPQPDLRRMIESPGYGVSGRGNFDALFSEQIFYRAQAVLSGQPLKSSRT